MLRRYCSRRASGGKAPAPTIAWAKGAGWPLALAGLGDERLGLDDRGVQGVELALALGGLGGDLGPQGGDLVGELLHVGLLGGDDGGLLVGLDEGLQDLFLELALGEVVVGDLVAD